MNEDTPATFEGIYCEEILNQLDPSIMYPKWVKRWSGYHYEEAEEECNCEEYDECYCNDTILVPDKDAVEYDVWVPYAPTLFGLLPKRPWSAKHK
ncbi:hypothetical protein LCGC14_2211470 [marine sediment metagenome]|uniref:Uncharacterized protein n=1 Tax=marine sediment metagenome TaxID=412755 RepID=A0A0F9DDL4_9ZZZZ